MRFPRKATTNHGREKPQYKRTAHIFLNFGVPIGRKSATPFLGVGLPPHKSLNRSNKPRIRPRSSQDLRQSDLDFSTPSAVESVKPRRRKKMRPGICLHS